jgi:CubicO group peptidase (beta-lactamase class C family)
MDRWLKAALDYIPRWIDFQMRQSEQPGCAIAIAHRGRLVLEQAFGHADLSRKVTLTPRHCFRVASHSKSFTAAGILKLREQGRLRLDDGAGQHVAGLHRGVARVTLAQLLSHSAGIIRDGTDAGQWTDRRPFLSAAELRADLARSLIIEPNTRFKYSNHGYGLLGLVIEALTGQPYTTWISREIAEAAGLEETWPDMPLPRGIPMARGHSARLPLGRRVLIPGDNPTRGLAAATGFVSTAADLVRFFSQLSPSAKRSVLSAASRREMVRRQWLVPHAAVERGYGLGIISGKIGDWEYFGHAGGFQGFITRTNVLPLHDLTLAVLTNAADGLAHPWLEGIAHILRCFAKRGAPPRRLSAWSGRWWSLWGAVDLVPAGDRVLVADPEIGDPFAEASEIEVQGRDRGRIALANGFASHGEEARLLRNKKGAVVAVQLAGSRLLPEGRAAGELEARYGRG